MFQIIYSLHCASIFLDGFIKRHLIGWESNGLVEVIGWTAVAQRREQIFLLQVFLQSTYFFILLVGDLFDLFPKLDNDNVGLSEDFILKNGKFCCESWSSQRSLI